MISYPRYRDPASNEALAEKYDAVAYAAQSNALTHPDNMAAVAALFGVESPAIETCQVLELGCSNGANLLPMAATLPNAHFVGCDLSARAIAAGRGSADELSLANVTLLEQDLRELPKSLGPFDYIIAHGVYSWVPQEVRDALLALAAERLSSHGVMFVSLNVYPGCRVRQAAWEMLHYHVDSIADPSARLDAARRFAALLALPGMTQNETDALLRNELRRLAERDDSALFHDDLAIPNDPVYFHEFVEHAAKHGLTFLAEAKLSMMSGTGLAPAMRELLLHADRIAREQYLDFARLRRFRHSLLCRDVSSTGFNIARERLRSMWIVAATPLLRAAAEGKSFGTEAVAGEGQQAAIARALLQWLAELSPRAVSIDEAQVWLEQRFSPEAIAVPDIETMIVDILFSGAADLRTRPVALAAAAGERPLASPVARWQAQRQEKVTNLRHETITLKDATARKLLSLLDGQHDVNALAAELHRLAAQGDRTQATQRVVEYVRQFARHALLLA